MVDDQLMTASPRNVGARGDAAGGEEAGGKGSSSAAGRDEL